MNLFSILFIVIMIGASWFSYPFLPNQVPTHWNARGEIDAYTAKQTAVWLFPLLVVGMTILFRVLPYFDPKKDKYKLFKHEWQIIQTVLVGFFVYVHLLTIYVAINPSISFLPLLFLGLGTLFVLMGNYLSKIRQNYFIGIRTPWTLADEDNWNKTHRFASWCFVIAGLATLLEAFFIWNAPIIIISGILLAAILPMIYSFLLFKGKPVLMKYVFASIVSIGLILLLARLASGEDIWICQNGQWIKHGYPSGSQPITECR